MVSEDKQNILDIQNEINELNDLIDKKCIEIYNLNDENENKIQKYIICKDILLK